MTNYIVSLWGREYNIKETTSIECMTKDTLYECKCGNKFICKRGYKPQYKYDNDDIKKMVKNNPILYYGNQKNMDEDFKTCECGNRFNNMKLLYPKYIPSIAPTIRIRTEPDLDISYHEDERKQTNWWELGGGVEEYKDIHHGDDPHNNDRVIRQT